MRRHLTLLIKLAITVGMFALIFSKIDLADIGAQLAQVKPGWLAAAFVLLTAQLVVVTFRWEAIMRRLGYRLGLRTLVLIQGYGVLFNQVLPSSVGGDVVRVGLLKADGVPVWTATRSVLSDRIFGLLGLILLLIPFLPSLHGLLLAENTPAHQLAFWSLVLVSVGGIAGAAIGIALHGVFARLPLIGRIFGPLLKDLNDIARDPKTLAAVIGSSLVGHGMLVLTVLCLAQALSAPLAFGHAFALVPVIMLLLAVPISFGGWGLREGLFATALAYAAIGGAAATAMSMLYGTLGLGLGLLGGLCYLILSRSEPVRHEQAPDPHRG